MKLFLAVLMAFFWGALCQDESELLLVQFVARHGARVPDVIDPNTAPFWEQWGDAGELTSLGVRQVRIFGDVMRRRYIDELQFLPSEWEHSKFRIYASSSNDRPLGSGQAFLQTFYPQDPVPLYTAEATWVNGKSWELLVNGVRFCPSYMIEVENQMDEFDEFLLNEYPDLVSNLTAITGFGSTLRPTDLVYEVQDNLVQQLSHSYPNILPYLVEHQDILRYLATEWLRARWATKSPDDPRSPINQLLKDTLVNNMRAALSGESEYLFHAFWGHSFSLAILWDVLGVPMYTPIESVDTLLLELRRRPNGEVFIRAEFVHTTDPIGTAFEFDEIPLNCPSPQLNCPMNDFISFLDDHNKRESDCCYKGRGFMEHCSNYLDPDVLNNPDCVLYRENCPATACGEGQILDAATMLCVPMNESEKDKLIYELQLHIQKLKDELQN